MINLGFDTPPDRHPPSAPRVRGSRVDDAARHRGINLHASMPRGMSRGMPHNRVSNSPVAAGPRFFRWASLDEHYAPQGYISECVVRVWCCEAASLHLGKEPGRY